MPSKKPPKILGSTWGFSNLWNAALHTLPERPLQKREYIYASELGLGFCDRYLKMNAVPYTNPPNDRSRRKFVAGHMWEWVVSLILTMCGILKERQLRGVVELPGLLNVVGKLDFIAGGQIDWEKAKAEVVRIQKLFQLSLDEMPPFINHAINHIMAEMEKQFKKNPLKEVVFECKSVSSYMSEKMQKSGAQSHHVLQTGHYIIANRMDEGLLTYICKDDCICTEFSIINSKELLRFYKDDVSQMTEHFRATNKKNVMKSLPPIEPEVLFEDGVFRFNKNFRVEYSNYLTLLYGFKTPEDYRNQWAKQISSWNYTFKRCAKGEKMTEKNWEVIRQAEKIFPKWDDYVMMAREAGVFQIIGDDETES
jgi:hypothetical protein